MRKTGIARRSLGRALGLAGASMAAGSLSAAEKQHGEQGVYDVTQFGASGDGARLNTASIQKAVDACSAAGGGIVYVPPGNYLSGTIVLKDGVTLRLEAGA